MRVLWFSNTPAAGDEYISSNGTGGWLKSLDKAIQDKIELHVAFYDRNYPNVFKVGRTTYHQIAPLDKLSLVKRRLIMLFSKRNPDLPRYKDIIEQVRPDIIHIHGTELPWIQLASHTNVPVLVSIQAILTVMNHKYFSGIEKKELRRNSKYIKDYKSFVKKAIIERENLRQIKYVMGRTDWDRRVYSVLAPNAHYFLGGEILRDGFYERKWEMNHRENRIVLHTTTGCLLFKGLETLCMALSILNRTGVEVEWRVAGVAEDSEFNSVIKKQMGKDYPKKGLLLLGSLNENELIEKMLEADIFVSPSHQDNSPNALCEAMMLGMPCISTFAGGSGTILKDGETGILVQDGDPWAMAGSILELSRNKQLALSYGNKARKEAEQRHNKSVVVSQVLDTYSSILEK